MSEDAIQPQVRALVADHIDSVVQAEILALLHLLPEREISADDVGRELRIDTAWAAAQLDHLCQRGLIACDREAARYKAGATTPELEDAVRGLVKAYSDRRVTLISMIFSKPIDKLRSFADAFRIRKDNEKDG